MMRGGPDVMGLGLELELELELDVAQSI